MVMYSRSGRPRPQSGGVELAIWYWMRVSGVALFVLALTHFSVQHFLMDPKDQNANWIFAEAWNNALRRGLDWLMLVFVLSHAFLGVRILLMDFWPRLTVYHKRLWYANWIIFFGFGLPGAFIIMRPALGL